MSFILLLMVLFFEFIVDFCGMKIFFIGIIDGFFCDDVYDFICVVGGDVVSTFFRKIVFVVVGVGVGLFKFVKVCDFVVFIVDVF